MSGTFLVSPRDDPTRMIEVFGVSVIGMRNTLLCFYDDELGFTWRDSQDFMPYSTMKSMAFKRRTLSSENRESPTPTPPPLRD